MLAEVVRLASAAMGQCFSWGAQEHRSTYERIIAATMRYSAIVNYVRAVEISLLPRHRALSSSSASTAASADACHLCRRVLGSEGTTAAKGAGLARLRATTVCSTRRRYFQ
jgi:shikimate kinase